MFYNGFESACLKKNRENCGGKKDILYLPIMKSPSLNIASPFFHKKTAALSFVSETDFIITFKNKNCSLLLSCYVLYHIFPVFKSYFENRVPGKCSRK